MKWFAFVAKSMMTNARRSLLTMAAVALALFMFVTLQTVNRAMEVDIAAASRETRLAILDHSGDMHTPLPLGYREQLARVPHVSAVSPVSFTVLSPGVEQSKIYLTLAVDPEAYRNVFRASLENIPGPRYDEFARRRDGIVVGRELAERSGWQVGDAVKLNSIPDKLDLDLTVCAIYADRNGSNKQMESQILMHHAYYEELKGRPGQSSFYWLLVDGRENDRTVMDALARDFADAPQEIAVETESSMLNRMNQLTQTLRQVIGTISFLVMGVVLMIVVNAIALSMRERRREIAIMKAIGFASSRVLGLVLAESVLLSLIAGSLGTLAAYTVFATAELSVTTILTFNFRVDTSSVMQGLALSALLGALGGLIPAWQASRVRVIAALRSL